MKHVLRPKPIIAVFYVVLGAVLLVFSVTAMALSLAEPGILIQLCGLLMFLALAVFSGWILVTPLVMKLILDDNGLEYHTFNYVLRTPWYALRRTEFGNGAVVLLLPDNPDIQPQPWLRVIWPLLARERIHAIPVGFFSLIFGRRLADTVTHIAPKLADQSPTYDVDWQ